MLEQRKACGTVRARGAGSEPFNGRLVAGVRSHPLIATLHTAFDEHRSVCLSPDVIWLTILQGLAHHVNANAEILRKHFVRHEGKLKIKVYRDDFVKGSSGIRGGRSTPRTRAA